MPIDDPIYDFPKTKAALKRRGIDVEYTGGYTIVNPTDVVFTNGRGNVEFKNEEGETGIYFKDGNGRYRQVFMYKRDYHLYIYGSPRYHICQCETIKEFMSSGGFREHYRYANTEEVRVQNMDNYNIEETVNNLKLCGHCSNMLSAQYFKGMPLREFVDVLKKAGEADPDEVAKEVDIFGYVKDWQKISEAKREIENYTCEICGFRADDMFDRRFIHVHHKDGNKLNNKSENLQCLCIRCHADIDERHRQNFSEGDKRLQLDEFNTLHKPCVRYKKMWELFDYCEEQIGKRSCVFGTRNGKRVGLYVGEIFIGFDKYLGEIDGNEGNEKLQKSLIIEKPNGTLGVFPSEGLEFIKID